MPQPTVLSRRSTASDAVRKQTFAPYVAAGKARTPSTRPVPPRSPPPLVCNGASVSVFIAQNGSRASQAVYQRSRTARCTPPPWPNPCHPVTLRASRHWPRGQTARDGHARLRHRLRERPLHLRGLLAAPPPRMPRVRPRCSARCTPRARPRITGRTNRCTRAPSRCSRTRRCQRRPSSSRRR